MPEPATRFVLKRLNWAEDWNDNFVRRPGEVTVASFATFEEADAERHARESKLREKLNPFECGVAVHYWTHLDEPRLRDWLMDHGIDPPAPGKDGKTNWAGWWKKHRKSLSDEKRAVVWDVLDKVRFFAVREELVRPVGYAVVAIDWQYNDNTYDANPHGCGEVLKVFRTRERAEQECAEMNDFTRDHWADMLDDDELAVGDEGSDYGLFDMQMRLRRLRGLGPTDRLKKGEGVYQMVFDAPFYEIIEVPLEGLE